MMHARLFSRALSLGALSLVLCNPLAYGHNDSTDPSLDDDKPPVSVTVSFGAGLNTAQPGNPLNHHILPKEIHIAKGGVVNFVVAGLHQIMVYLPGVRAQDVPSNNPPFFINYREDKLLYKGIAPAGGPAATPATSEPSNASNRIESVSFQEAGTYLVICNVRPHFADGMYAYVVVH